MPGPYALDFRGIPDVLAQNATIRNKVAALVASEPMPGRVTEGGTRVEQSRAILQSFVAGDIDLREAYRRTAAELPRSTSIHASSNRVFADGWAERHVRTQLSRFYNHAVMEMLLAEGITTGRVAHSRDEEHDCGLIRGGPTFDLTGLRDRSVAAYRDGNWDGPGPRIPDHPHCTHAISPPE